MDTFTNALTTLASKPATGILISGLTTIGLWIGLVTPILAFLTLIVGLGAAIYSLNHNRNLVKEDKKRKNYD
jgi:hypothetical protein